jgi:hypothetical protein
MSQRSDNSYRQTELTLNSRNCLANTTEGFLCQADGVGLVD